MMSLCLLIVVVGVTTTSAQEFLHPEEYINYYPEWYLGESTGERHRRDVTLDHKVGDGRVYGTLGGNDNGLFGKAGYDRQIFNDHRGQLNGGVYGTRVLGPNGDSSHLGGALNWQNSNAAASLDVSKQIHGPSSVRAGAGGMWPIGKNGDFSLQGTYGRTSGMKPEYGGMGNIRYRW